MSAIQQAGQHDKLALVVIQTETLKQFLASQMEGEALDVAISIVESAEVAVAEFSEEAREFMRDILEQRDEAVGYALEMETQRDVIADQYGYMAQKLENANGMLAYYEEQYPAELFAEAADMTINNLAETFAEMTGEPTQEWDTLFNQILNMELDEETAVRELSKMLEKAVAGD